MGQWKQVGIADGLENEGSVVRKNLCFPLKKFSRSPTCHNFFLSPLKKSRDMLGNRGYSHILNITNELRPFFIVI